MSEVFRILANGVASLGTPLASRRFMPESQTPFKDDRRNLAYDWLRVKQDISKSIERVNKEDGSKARSR